MTIIAKTGWRIAWVGDQTQSQCDDSVTVMNGQLMSGVVKAVTLAESRINKPPEDYHVYHTYCGHRIPAHSCVIVADDFINALKAVENPVPYLKAEADKANAKLDGMLVTRRLSDPQFFRQLAGFFLGSR